MGAELTFIDANIPLQKVPSKRRRLRQHQFARFMRWQRSCRSSFSASGYAQIRGRARGELFWSERRARLGLPNKRLKQTVAVATAFGRGSAARSLTAVRWAAYTKGRQLSSSAAQGLLPLWRPVEDRG